MITEDLVSFEVGKLLKQKGFDEPCRNVYEEKNLRTNTLCDYLNSELSSYVCAPTLQMAMKWLREVHHKYCDIGYDIDIQWFFHIIELKELKEHFDYSELKYYHAENETGFNSYEEACEAAVKYCLKNLIK